jgi:hypothetical protein
MAEEIPHWYDVVERATPYVVRITTPGGSGTGFVISHSSTQPICAIATAAHVIEHSHYWEQPIRIEHHASKGSLLLRHPERSIIINSSNDTAVVIFAKADVAFPGDALGLVPEGKVVKIGVEVGWLGFPAVSPRNLCFFSGRVSAWLPDEHAYLIDGVSINGVSGGPTLFRVEGGPWIVGVVSAYIPNRATGETLPGLAVVRDVSQFYETVRDFKSFFDAKKEESPVPVEPPPLTQEPAG